MSILRTIAQTFKKPKLQNILCFGDSLTAGYVFTQIEDYPYSIKLHQLLEKNGYNFKIDNQGVSGETTMGMLPRFTQLVSDNHYDIAVILGGTNDIGMQQSDLTTQNLLKMHDLCKEKNITSVIVTIPKSGHDDEVDWLVELRDKINNNLKEYSKQNNISLLDLETLMPYESLSEDNRKKLWSELGLTWERRGIHWALWEPTEGNFQWNLIDYSFTAAASTGLHSLVYLVGCPAWASTTKNTSTDTYPPENPAVYANRLVMLAQRYPAVEYWEVWNEMNLIGFWKPSYDPVGYNSLFQAVVSAFSTAGILHKLCVGGVAYYGNTVSGTLMFSDLYPMGTFATDPVVSYHPYTDLPEGSIGQEATDTYAFYNTAIYLDSLLRTHAGLTNVWATEWGWSSYPVATDANDQPIIGESGQADFTIKRALLTLAVNFNRTFLFTLTDLDARASLRDQYYGLIRLDLTLKPVYSALKNLFSLTGPTLYPFTLNASTTNVPSDLVAYSYISSSNTLNVALYKTTNGTTATMEIQVNATANLTNVLTKEVTYLTPQENGYVSILVTHNLQILEWRVTESSNTSQATTSQATTSQATTSQTTTSQATTQSTTTQSSSTGSITTFSALVYALALALYVF